MADVQPMTVSRFEPTVAGDLDRLVAPPYDVIDPAYRAELLERSSHNVVAIDLPEDPAGGDRYEHAARLMSEWFDDRVLVADEAPSIWALSQRFRAPDGVERVRNALLARVRVEEYGRGRIRAHERTQPGPRQDRLDLTRATGFNLSPIFSLTTDDAWPCIARQVEQDPWATTRDPDGTENRIWRVEDPDAIGAVTATLAESELLIADGHHRYETARVYADEVGGEGPHRYTLMALTALADPGLAVYATHRLLTQLDSTGVERLERDLDRSFEIEDVDRAGVAPGEGDEGIGVLGYVNGQSGREARLRLRPDVDLAEAMPDRSDAYRRLDSAILESLVLNRILGMSAEDVEAKRGIEYAKSVEQVDDALGENAAQAAFLMRPTPMDAVRLVADAGETMPPKSTFFYPKIPTGIVFNPVRGAER